MSRGIFAIALSAVIGLGVTRGAAQDLAVVFEDDFSATAIDPNKYVPDAPFFEGGIGDVHAEIGGGVMKFVGTTTQQWWSGGTLKIVPTFTATPDTPVTLTIDRVAEAGVGTASRSALWILDESLTKYVLFADVRAEGGWRFNRKIGEDGDVPTGSGTDIAAFNGGNYDDGLQHEMKMVADGENVKLFVDGVEGATVKFPFSKVVFQFGSYARANNDTADTTWDNLKIQTIVRPTNVIFSDDFSSNTIDPSRYEPDAPFFEGGVGDIHAEAGNDVMTFVGTTTQQWWSGGTLRIVPLFFPSDSETITLTIDRVSEQGMGTASRSALWILDETRTKYVLFADVRGEGGWRYNRKIGEDGDVPTGGGTVLTAFDGANFDDGGLHQMSMVADGKTVKLLLDGIQGAEVRFPFSPVIFEFGAYARANNDTANTVWDNLKIESAGSATFLQPDVNVRAGQLSQEVTVRIPPGLNSQRDVSIQVTSANSGVAVPEGGSNGVLNLTFPTGGANTQTFRVSGVAVGGTEFSLSGDLGGGNRLSVAVLSDPGIVLQDDFAGATLNTSRWAVSNQGFEAGTGDFSVTQSNGALQISGGVSTEFWPGASIKSVNGYVATRDLNLVVEVDRVSVAPDIGVRTGLWLTTADRSQYVFFSQNVGTDDPWRVNVNPGSATGAGVILGAFSGVADQGNHRLGMIANGSTVEVFLDGISGGVFPFPVKAGIHVEVGTYGELPGDAPSASFDNLVIENRLPCIEVAPQVATVQINQQNETFTVSVPQLLNDSTAVNVTVTSQNPDIAVPAGAVNGVLNLVFEPGASNAQTINIRPLGLGVTTFQIATDSGACVAGDLRVEIVAFPEEFLADDFSGGIDSAIWEQVDNPLVDGTATADSSVSVENGQVKINVTSEGGTWAGKALFTVNSYSASVTTPLTFEVDRTELDFVLVTGTGAYQRAGIWVRDANGNYILFSENVAHDGRNFGWRYNRMIGQNGDNPTDDGINIAAFDGGNFDNQGNHRMKIVVNGETARLYLDGVLGAEVAFPFSQGLTFGFGSYVAAATDVVTGYFDNAVIRGGMGTFEEPSVLSASIDDGALVITWTGNGTLQQSGSVGNGANWQAVTPAPTGNRHSIPLGQLGSAGFFRIVR